MSRPVALSRIVELGIRSRADPAVQPTVWSGMPIDGGGLRALHEALHPSLLLLTLAGYHIDQVVLGRRGAGDVLVFTLSPRSAVAMPWGEYLETGGEPDWPFMAPFTVLMWLKLRHGLGGEVVDVGDVTMIAGFPFLTIDVESDADLAAIATSLPFLQEPLRHDLASRITQAWWETDWSVATTGLLSALEPDLWTFPDLTPDEDLRRQAFRRLGEAIADPVLATEPGLEAFLVEEAAVRDGEHPPSVRDRLEERVPDQAADIERAWKSEAEALWAQTHPDAAGDPFRRADHRLLSYCELVFDMLNESLISLAGFAPPLEEGAYGGYDLQRGDRDPAQGDTQWRYGGTDIVGQAPLPTYIDELRGDLDRIGFGPLADGDMANDPTTAVNEATQAATLRLTFGAYLEAAVREFQIYASMDNVARIGRPEELPIMLNPSLATSLMPQVNDQPYRGPISGVVNAETRALLKMWVERDWHCPVVVEARVLPVATLERLRDPASTADKANLVTGEAIAAEHENVWRRTQLEDDDYTFIAWDLTQHYPAPATRPWGVPVVISRWDDPQSWGGALADVGVHTWPEAEVTPVNLVGADPDPAERPQQGAFWSTYRVIRAISEVECMGVLDGMNAWDSAIVSGGPVHFTLGLCRRAGGGSLHDAPANCVVYRGELCPVLSLLAAEDEREYERLFGVFGLQPFETWEDPPAELFSSAHRKYRGWIRLQNEAGDFVDPRKETQPDARGRLAANHDDFLLVETLHHWHWIYRWQMAPRLSERFREITYRLARARLRALLSTPWGMLSGAPAGLTLGEVFTSEKAVAIIERLHVFSPPILFMVENIDAEWRGSTVIDISFAPIQGAFDAAAATGGPNPADWGDVEEAAAVRWLETCGLKQPDDDVPTLVRWPIQASYRNRKHDLSLLPVAMEEAPDISDLPPMAAAPGAETRARFLVSDRETEPGGCAVSATSADEDVLVAGVEPVGGMFYDLVLNPPAGAEGEVRVTVRARDRRHVTTREVMVNVTADETLPDGDAADYVRPAPVGLSELRWSFELDDSDLFEQPPD